MPNLTLLTAIKRVQESWGMSDAQIAALIQVDLTIYSRWMMSDSHTQESSTIPQGMDNAMALASIFQSLNHKFKNTEDQIKWLFTEHQDFGGQKPIDIAASSAENLFWLSYYLASTQSHSHSRE